MDNHPEGSGCQCPACFKDTDDRKVMDASFRSGNEDVMEILDSAIDSESTECVILLLYPKEPFYKLLHTECSIEKLVGRLELAKHEIINYKIGVTDERTFLSVSPNSDDEDETFPVGPE